jgi:hypothetical protein
MDEDEAPGSDPEIQPRRSNMPPQGDEYSHQHAQYKDRGKLVCKAGHGFGWGKLKVAQDGFR